MNPEVSLPRSVARRFNRGAVISIHVIGFYHIVEFWEHVFQNGSETSQINWNSRKFCPYVDINEDGIPVDTNEVYTTLDEALAAAIARRHEGPNHKADVYFLKSMGVEIDRR